MSVLILRGDARCLPLPDESVDLLVTSPPYFGLRQYTDGGKALAGQIGSEETPAEYLANLWDCTREWMRVLKPCGSIFVTLGDSYYSGKGAPGKTTTDPKNAGRNARRTMRSPLDYGLDFPRKSLLGMPWRYALGCVDQLGLILRAEIVWAKPSGLPESVTDRVRRSHEQVFHFTRHPRYYAAVDEIREPHAEVSVRRAMPHRSPPGRRGPEIYSGQHGQMLRLDQMNNPLGKLPGSVWEVASVPLTVPDHLGVDHFAAFPPSLVRPIILDWSPPGICTECGEGRWPVVDRRPMVIRPSPRRLAPQASGDLGRTAPGGTVVSPAEARITGYTCACTPYTDHPANGTTTRRGRVPPATRPQGTYGRKQAGEYERVGPWREYHLDRWSAPPARPALVVDPFGGTGTTVLVADVLGRTGISVDLSADYGRIARWRTSDPGERARAMQVPKPPPVPDGQGSLFDGEAVS